MAENKQKDQQETPKIIVDDDWKAQAQAEKEKLAESSDAHPKESTAPSTPAASGVPGGETQPRELPPANFSTFVSMLATQTFLALGGVEDPETKKRYVDLDLAKHHIDMLVVIEEKTQGNLTDDEKKLLDEALYRMRMQYVQITQQVSQV